MSPIELTTGTAPRSVASMLHRGGGIIDVIDEDATLTVMESARTLVRHMEDLYDAANLARRAKSAVNRKNTDGTAVPDIDVGDFVLYAQHKKDTKLDYTWLGPAVVTEMVTPLVYTNTSNFVKPFPQ